MLMVFLSGCDAIPPEYEKNWIQLQKEWDALVIVMTGGKSPLAKTAPRPSSSPSPSGPEMDAGTQSARNAKANAELLHEMYRVVYNREPKDRSEFGSYVDSMNQGASLEGVYNGFTHSSDFRKFEITNPGASPGALKAFGEELAVLEAELPVPVEFEAAATQPLALPVQPGVEPALPPTPGQPHRGADGVHVIEYGKVPQPGTSPAPSVTPGVDVKALGERYTQQFVGASIFTLKRIMGDEALRVIASKKEYPEKLALWYSKWVVHMAARGVDFGVSQRNLADEGFHYRWALAAGDDRLKWEVLNRLHRVLNDANRPKQ
jgi:hypothetical protein